MTREEAIQVLTLLKAAYPRFYTGMTRADAEAAISLWASMLADMPFEVVKIAIEKYMAVGKFPPTIADIRESALNTKELTGDEAFGQAVEAVKRYGYYREAEALSSIHADVAKVIKNLGYKDLCMLEDGKEKMTYRAHFLRLWEDNKTATRKQAMIPKGLAEKLDAIPCTIKSIEG